MRDKDVIQHIQDLCKERSWTYYRLAKEADIPYSTLNNMVNRTNIPGRVEQFGTFAFLQGSDATLAVAFVAFAQILDRKSVV